MTELEAMEAGKVFERSLRDLGYDSGDGQGCYSSREWFYAQGLLAGQAISELGEYTKLEKICYLIDVLTDIANTDFRGNRSTESVKAYRALKVLEDMK